jgi:hypothetical protein
LPFLENAKEVKEKLVRDFQSEFDTKFSDKILRATASSLDNELDNLFNQTELMEERQKFGVYDVRPGITGLAQVNQIDMSTPRLLAETDAEMIKNYNLFNIYYYNISILQRDTFFYINY